VKPKQETDELCAYCNEETAAYKSGIPMCATHAETFDLGESSGEYKGEQRGYVRGRESGYAAGLTDGKLQAHAKHRERYDVNFSMEDM